MTWSGSDVACSRGVGVNVACSRGAGVNVACSRGALTRHPVEGHRHSVQSSQKMRVSENNSNQKKKKLMKKQRHGGAKGAEREGAQRERRVWHLEKSISKAKQYE